MAGSIRRFSSLPALKYAQMALLCCLLSSASMQCVDRSSPYILESFPDDKEHVVCKVGGQIARPVLLFGK
jgi:hypothetical protein